MTDSFADMQKKVVEVAALSFGAKLFEVFLAKAMQEKGWTIDDLAQAYNAKYAEDIKAGDIEPMTAAHVTPYAEDFEKLTISEFVELAALCGEALVEIRTMPIDANYIARMKQLFGDSVGAKMFMEMFERLAGERGTPAERAAVRGLSVVEPVKPGPKNPAPDGDTYQPD